MSQNLTGEEDHHGGPLSTYYGLPALKKPVWKPYVPAYFYVGGVAGACAALAAAAQLFGGARLRHLVRRARWIAAGGAVVSGAFLIIDLGRPSRFLYMLRVFRPTSPMNLGTWLLTSFGGASAAAAMFGWPSAGVVAGMLGLPLTTYTAVLLSNTAVPVWNGARRTMPLLFAASAVSSAASLLEMLPARASERPLVHRLALAGKLAELAGAEALERELGSRGPGPVRAPLRRGGSGALWRAAKVITAASAVLELLPRRRHHRIAAGVTGTVGALLLRFALVAAGRASATDPKATFQPQRARLAARSEAKTVTQPSLSDAVPAE